MMLRFFLIKSIYLLVRGLAKNPSVVPLVGWATWCPGYDGLSCKEPIVHRVLQNEIF